MSDIAKRLIDAVDHSEQWSDDYHQDPDLWAVAREAADEIERLQTLAAEWFDPDPCWFDHHGDCQAHGFTDLGGDKCPNEVVRELLASKLAPDV